MLSHVHHHQTSDYWTRHHDEHVVLDIGDDVGALVLHTPRTYHGREIEVSPLGRDGRRIHAAVLERSAMGQTMFAAVYAELQAGMYRIWGDDPRLPNEVTISAGAVAEVDWR